MAYLLRTNINYLLCPLCPLASLPLPLPPSLYLLQIHCTAQVMISGYNRNTSIIDSEFHLVGENGIVSWGYTADFPDSNRAVPIPFGQGGDASDGNHPKGSQIKGNIFHGNLSSCQTVER